MNEKLFVEELKKINIDISENQLALLNNYYELLIEWNEKINLTSITGKEDVYLKHFYDSLTLFEVCDLKEKITICDIGSGAGFPGIVLKIIFPNLKITMVDSLGKRVTFLNMVIDTLKLSDIEAFHTRAEKYVKKHRDEFDIVTSRAVARLNILTELCLPLVKINGYFIAMKGKSSEEISEIENNIKILSSEIVLIHQLTLPVEGSNRTLIKIKKMGYINNKYPRDFEKIKKKPL